jgi:predicted transcriptional regulator of viral defense system
MTELWRFGSEPPNQNAKVRVSQLAERQYGRVSWAQLTTLKISKASANRWVREGYLHRLLPGVYAVGHRAPTTEGDLAAALLYAGPGAALGGQTALWWFGLIDKPPRVIEVTTPNRRASRPGLRVNDRKHTSRIWQRSLPVTPVAYALLEYAVSAPHDRVRRVLAEAEYRRLIDLDAAYAFLRRGRPGSAKLRAALMRHQPRLALTRSVLEERFLALCESARLPLPECNATIEGLMLDMLWRVPRVIVPIALVPRAPSLRPARPVLSRVARARIPPPVVQPVCAVGLIRISLTSTCAGWEIANMTARATSSGWSASETGLSKKGVSTIPGSTTVTRTPVSCSSCRADSPIAVTAHLVAEYSDPGSARRPATEPVSTRWPRDCLSAGSVARMVSAAP